MKKTSLWAGVLFWLFALPQGYAANQGKVTFSGKVLAARLCNVTTETAGKTVDLGRVMSHQFTGVGTTVGGTDFTLSVKNCGETPNTSNANRLKYYFVSPNATPQIVNGNSATSVIFANFAAVSSSLNTWVSWRNKDKCSSERAAIPITT
ncbi:f17 fimbrial protein [Haemophilus influenzae HK1212]|uniref:F17 fimbrial protein n=1 Tax=Haemophilus influenzae HK1212 TaxID=456482 RepID=A0A7G2JZT8_HAEIF|nr:f17 fimbrial protein [Haemophilus influenzae HK1212]